MNAKANVGLLDGELRHGDAHLVSQVWGPVKATKERVEKHGNVYVLILLSISHCTEGLVWGMDSKAVLTRCVGSWMKCFAVARPIEIQSADIALLFRALLLQLLPPLVVAPTRELLRKAGNGRGVTSADYPPARDPPMTRSNSNNGLLCTYLTFCAARSIEQQ